MVDRATRELVRQRANLRCEYCGLEESSSPIARLQIEHIRAIKHGGGDEADNLALACIDCNLRKGPNLSGIDPETGSVEILFNPRTQNWTEHFALQGSRIEGRTACGRATVAVLDMNSVDRIQTRIALG